MSSKFDELYNKIICQWEEYVDQNGWAHDDQGNSWYVGKGVAEGTYGLHDRNRSWDSWYNRNRPYGSYRRSSSSSSTVDPNAPKCPKCGSSMKLRKGKFGNFWGCSKYPSCNGVKHIATTNRTYGAPINNDDDENTNQTTNTNTNNKPQKLQPIKQENGEFICPECGKQLIKRQGKFGQFFGCSNYPTCKYTAKVK